MRRLALVTVVLAAQQFAPWSPGPLRFDAAHDALWLLDIAYGDGAYVESLPTGQILRVTQ